MQKPLYRSIRRPRHSNQKRAHSRYFSSYAGLAWSWLRHRPKLHSEVGEVVLFGCQSQCVASQGHSYTL